MQDVQELQVASLFSKEDTVRLGRDWPAAISGGLAFASIITERACTEPTHSLRSAE